MAEPGLDPVSVTPGLPILPCSPGILSCWSLPSCCIDSGIFWRAGNKGEVGGGKSASLCGLRSLPEEADEPT